MLAPPWIPVPPSGYGGIESVVAMLSGALEAVGRLGEIDRQRCREDTIGRYDIDHVAAAYEHAYERVVAAARGG